MMQKASVKKPRGSKKTGADAARPAQYRFLNELVNDRRTVAIFLINGLKLEGKIASFDDYAILLEGEMSDHVYKHAVSTIQPMSSPVVMPEPAARKVATRAAPVVELREPERKPKQPTIVVRPKRRIIKRDPE